MFRLTVVLLAGLYATMLIWGEPPESDVPVARADAMSPAVPALAGGGSLAAATATPPDAAGPTEEEAVQLAIEATRKKAAPTEAIAARAAPAEEEEVPLWYVTGTRVNLRSGPSQGAAVVGGVSLGDRAEVLSDPGEPWIRIRTEGGTEAWIYGRYLSETPA